MNGEEEEEVKRSGGSRRLHLNITEKSGETGSSGVMLGSTAGASKGSDDEVTGSTLRSLSTAEIREVESDRPPFRRRRALKLSLLTVDL